MKAYKHWHSGNKMLQNTFQRVLIIAKTIELTVAVYADLYTLSLS